MRNSSSILLISFLNFDKASAATTETYTSYNQQIAVESALDNVIKKVNTQIAQGNSDISVTQYVPEVGSFVGIDFSTTKKGKTGYASYHAKVNGYTFSHTLLGDFTYNGKVVTASKEVRTSGFAFSHTSTSKIKKLDPSVWQVSSTAQHKWLGSIGKYTGLGYTSYITINLYGSGTSKLVRATYNTGV